VPHQIKDGHRALGAFHVARVLAIEAAINARSNPLPYTLRKIHSG